MEVRGKAIYTIPKGIFKKFGKEGLDRWLDFISPGAKVVYSFPINTKDWFPLKETLVEPMANVAQLFYDWNLEKAGWEFGGFSAEYGIKGLYGMFFKLASPGHIISKAVDILPSYYRPCALKVVENKKGFALIRITHFPEIDKTTEYRIGGWVLTALQINGQKNPEVKITKLLTNFDSCTEYQAFWETK